MAGRQGVEQWGVYEAELSGPSEGNPFVDVELTAGFRHRNRVVEVDSFYDGDGVFRENLPGFHRLKNLRRKKRTYLKNSHRSDRYGHNF